jgi:hypothetical protein
MMRIFPEQKFSRADWFPGRIMLRWRHIPGLFFSAEQTWRLRRGSFWQIPNTNSGNSTGKWYLMDEIHTPDSSRYFYAEGYAERQASGERQKQLSKEFVREWLMANGFQGKDGQQMPVMPDEFVNEISERYIELYEKVTGRSFVRDMSDDPNLA